MNRDLPENKFFEDFYIWFNQEKKEEYYSCLLYTSPSPRDGLLSRMPSSA